MKYKYISSYCCSEDWYYVGWEQRVSSAGKVIGIGFFNWKDRKVRNIREKEWYKAFVSNLF